MKTRYFFLFLFFFFIIIGVVLLKGGITGNVIGVNYGNYDNPEKVIDNINQAIEFAEEKGEYKCCIEPACTMCYLGKWKFEKGTCYCDDAIAENREEDVCPECKKGLENGICESAGEKECEI